MKPFGNIPSLVGFLFVCLCFNSCHNRTEDGPSAFYETTVAKASESFPGPLLVEQPIEHLDDILEFERCIKLEVTEESLIASITDVEYLDRQWFILDQDQNQVLRFADDGRFLGTVSRRGEGPGEFNFAYFLTSWEGKLVVSDSYNIHLFHPDGRWFSTIPIAKDRLKLSPLVTFHQGTIIAPLHGTHRSMPPYGVATLISPQKAEPLFGFGQHMPVQFTPQGTIRDEIGRHLVKAFSLVGDRIWVSPPLKADVEVYDIHGAFLQELRLGIDGLTYDDFKDVRSKQETYKTLQSKFRTERIWYLDPYVITVSSTGRNLSYSVFDVNGNLLKARAGYHPVIHGMGAVTTQGMLVESIPLSLYADRYMAKFDDDAQRRIYESGFDPANKDEDNPYLLVSRLK